jgi:fumarate hydratase class II
MAYDQRMTRTEHDPLGDFPVPDDAWYGIQTARAVANFPISGLRMPTALVHATVRVKRAAARANAALGRLPAEIADAIVAAADEVLAGSHRDQFVVDVYQAGAGTSHHMNVNEVLANLAGARLGDARGSYRKVHPNDHVNMGQSTNDVFPTSTRLALLPHCAALAGAAEALATAFDEKASAYSALVKVGRTHLMDAVPMTLGQQLGGYAACLRSGAADVAVAARQLHELNLGATAVGTGLNAGDDFTRLAVEALAADTLFPLVPARNRFRVTQSMGDIVAVSGSVRRLAVEAAKIASDLRLLASGPRAGLAEIVLPAVQPGSSIMPGKVNPSVPEMVNQVCYQVFGCDTTVMTAGEAGQLELNVMMPVIAWNALHAAHILAQALIVLRTHTVEGLVADEARCQALLDRSTAVATALSPYLGYQVTADVAKTAVMTDRSIRDVVLERGLMSEADLDRVLSAVAMTRPGIVGDDARRGGGARAPRDEDDDA